MITNLFLKERRTHSMTNLKLMNLEETMASNGGGAVLFAVKLFFKIIFTPGEVY